MDFLPDLNHVVTVGATVGFFAMALARSARRFLSEWNKLSTDLLTTLKENGNSGADNGRVSNLEHEVDNLKRAQAALSDDALRYMKKGTQALRRAKEMTGIDEEEEQATPEELAAAQTAIAPPVPEQGHRVLTREQMLEIARMR